MTTLCRAYTTEDDAQAVVDHLLSGGLPGADIRVLMGRPEHDHREAPVGRFAGDRLAPTDPVGAFAGAAVEPGRNGRVRGLTHLPAPGWLRRRRPRHHDELPQRRRTRRRHDPSQPPQGARSRRDWTKRPRTPTSRRSITAASSCSSKPARCQKKTWRPRSTRSLHSPTARMGARFRWCPAKLPPRSLPRGGARRSGLLGFRLLKSQRGSSRRRTQRRKPRETQGFRRCAEEDSTLHPVIPDQALNLVTRVSDPSYASRSSRYVRRIWTHRTQWTIWMLPRMLPRSGTGSCALHPIGVRRLRTDVDTIGRPR